METATVLTMNRPHFRSVLAVVAAYVGLVLLLVLTDPRKLPIVALMGPFILLFLAIYLTIKLVITMFFPGLERRKRVFIGSCVAGVPSFLLLLSSVNQLTWRDVALVSFLMIALLFYNSRASFSGK